MTAIVEGQRNEKYKENMDQFPNVLHCSRNSRPQTLNGDIKSFMCQTLSQNFEKATICFVMTLCPSFCMKQIDSH